MLTYAAQVADIIGINATMSAGAVGPEAISTMTAEAVDGKVDIIRDTAGDRFNHVEMNIRAFLVNITDDAASAISRLAAGMGVAESMVAETPFALMGPPSKLIEDLIARRERWGFSYVIVGGEDIKKFAPVVAALSGK